MILLLRLTQSLFLYLLACSTDLYEFYQYVHLSQVRNCVGSCVGCMTALRGMYKEMHVDRPIEKHILQESFINTMSAWANMLLLASTDPIKMPVGTCATAIESHNIGYEMIIEDKPSVGSVGGFHKEEGSYEFANMKTIRDTEEEQFYGRTHLEMSRPRTTTRNGFRKCWMWRTTHHHC